MVLLVAAGLLIRSFSKLTAVSPGFDTAHIVKANVSLPRDQYKTPQQWLAFTDDLLARVQAEPGMQDSALVVPTPLADTGARVRFEIVGQPPATAAESRTGDYVAATPNYLRVMGIPLVAGRFFTASDVMSAPRVTCISAAMARVYFPNQNPIGKRISFSFPPDLGVRREIVGIVADVRDSALGEDPQPMMYVPFAQAPSRSSPDSFLCAAPRGWIPSSLFVTNDSPCVTQQHGQKKSRDRRSRLTRPAASCEQIGRARNCRRSSVAPTVGFVTITLIALLAVVAEPIRVMSLGGLRRQTTIRALRCGPRAGGVCCGR